MFKASQMIMICINALQTLSQGSSAIFSWVSDTYLRMEQDLPIYLFSNYLTHTSMPSHTIHLDLAFPLALYLLYKTSGLKLGFLA